MPARIVPALLITSVLALAACGSAPVRGPDGPDASGSAGIPALPAPGAFYTAGLTDYGASATTLPADQIETRMARELARALQPPPALDCLAREYAARFGADGRDPGPGTVGAMAHHCGYWTRPINPYSVTAPDEGALLEHARKLPSEVLDGTIGLGVVPHPDGKVTMTLLRDPGAIRLDAPVARSTGAALLMGRLIRGDGRLEMWIDDADGPRRIELKVADTGKFSGEMPAGARRIELALAQGRFLQTLALFDRRPAPDAYPPTPAPPGAGDLRAAADAVAARIDALREAEGLTPLVHERRLDPVLDDWMHRIAAGNADDAPPGMLDERGWPYARLRYGISSGRTVEQVVDLLVETPTGRRAVMTDQVDRVAIGLRPFAGGDGFDAVFAAVQTFGAIAPAEARTTLLAALNAARARDASAPLKAAPALDDVAQALAEDALAGKRPWPQVVPAAIERVTEARLARGGFAAGAFSTVTLEDAPFDQEPAAMTADMTVIGIGVASGPLPDGGAPRHLVVFVVAEGVAVEDI